MMKKCQLCGHVEDGAAPTCTMCGEATWAELEKAFEEPPAVEETEPPPEPPAAEREQPKKGRKKP